MALVKNMYLMPHQFETTMSGQFKTLVVKTHPLIKAVTESDTSGIGNYIATNSDLKSKESSEALFIAANNGFATGVRLLFQAGVDPDVRIGMYTPLMIACVHGHTECVRELLKIRPRQKATSRNISFSTMKYADGTLLENTALYYAVQKNNIDCVKLLVSNSAQVGRGTLSMAINKPLIFCQELFKSQASLFDSETCYYSLRYSNLTKRNGPPEDDIVDFFVENVNFTLKHQSLLFHFLAQMRYERWENLLSHGWPLQTTKAFFSHLKQKFNMQSIFSSSSGDEANGMDDINQILRVIVDSDASVYSSDFNVIFNAKFLHRFYDLEVLETFFVKYKHLTFEQHKDVVLQCPYDVMIEQNLRFVMDHGMGPIVENKRLVAHVATKQEFERALIMFQYFDDFHVVLQLDEIEWPNRRFEVRSRKVAIHSDCQTKITGDLSQIRCSEIKFSGCSFPTGLVLYGISVGASVTLTNCAVETGLTVDSQRKVDVRLDNTTFENCLVGISASKSSDVWCQNCHFSNNDWDIQTGQFHFDDATGIKVDSSLLQSASPQNGDLVVINDTVGHVELSPRGWYKIPGMSKNVRKEKVFALDNVGEENYFPTLVNVDVSAPARVYPLLYETIQQLKLIEYDWNFDDPEETIGIVKSALLDVDEPDLILCELTFDTEVAKIGDCLINLFLQSITNFDPYTRLFELLFESGAAVSKHTAEYAIENEHMTTDVLELCLQNGAAVSLVLIRNAVHMSIEKDLLQIVVNYATEDTSSMIKALIHEEHALFDGVFDQYLEKLEDWIDTGVIGYAIANRDNIDEDFQYEWIEALLEAGADINTKYNGYSPLYWCAVDWGDLESFNKMLQIADLTGQIEDILRYVGNDYHHNEMTPEKLLCAAALMDVVETIPFARYLAYPLPVDSDDFFAWIVGNDHVIDILLRRSVSAMDRKPYFNPNLIPLTCTSIKIQHKLMKAGASPWWPKRWRKETVPILQQELVKSSESQARQVLFWHGAALQFLPYKMQNNPSICLQAVEQDGLALHWCSINRKMDLEIVQKAVVQNWRAFRFLPEKSLEHEGRVLPLPAQNYAPWVLWVRQLFDEGGPHEGQWTEFMTTFPDAAALAMYRPGDDQERKKAINNDALKSFVKRVDDLYKHRIIEI